MVAIFLPECGGGGCSRVEHQRIGASPVGVASLVRPLRGCGTRGCRVVRGGDTLLGYEAARSSRFAWSLWWLGESGMCGWSSLMLVPCMRAGVGVGLFLENYIVDASIIVSNFEDFVSLCVA